MRVLDTLTDLVRDVLIDKLDDTETVKGKLADLLCVLLTDKLVEPELDTDKLGIIRLFETLADLLRDILGYKLVEPELNADLLRETDELSVLDKDLLRE